MQALPSKLFSRTNLATASPVHKAFKSRTFRALHDTSCLPERSAGWAFLLGFTCAAAYTCRAAMPRNLDPDGFDPVRDTVGAGVYGGKVKKDANGRLREVIWGEQYACHCKGPGPVYLGKGAGLTDVNQAVSDNDVHRLEQLLSEAAWGDEWSGAPLSATLTAHNWQQLHPAVVGWLCHASVYAAKGS
eukprot:1148876-Pelagomonas_calceolata.AAC.2